MRKSLLPPNATELERAVEKVISAGLDIPDLLIRSIWNPDTCPMEVLPWLAWALSVDQWDESWIEEVKRNVVRRAVMIHRSKGTLFAVKQAVSAVYADSIIKEWFEYNGSPYHFIIELFAGTGEGFIYASQMTEQIRKVVFAAKNVRSQLQAIQVNFSNNGETPRLGTATQSGMVIEIYLEIPRELVLENNSSRFTVGLQELNVIRVYPLGV